MRAAVFAGPRSISVVERPDPVIEAPTDAVVRVVMGSVSGQLSNLRLELRRLLEAR